MIQLTLAVNGEARTVNVAPETTLLTLLRQHLNLTGAKLGCDVGDCGACTVLLDGKPINACLMLAAQADGRAVLTIEGLATREALHPLQQAFEAHGALQCGFCGPGVLLAAKALLDENPAPTRPQIRDVLAGNLCRCTGYAKMIDAIEHVAKERPAAAVAEKESVLTGRAA